MPTQNELYVLGVFEQLTVGTVHEANALVKEEPSTA
jgi:hypothetical protein